MLHKRLIREFLTSQHDEYSSKVADRIWELVEIKVMRLCSCKFQYNQINQTCDHN